MNASKKDPTGNKARGRLGRLGKAQEDAILASDGPGDATGRDRGIFFGCVLILIPLMCAGGAITYHFSAGLPFSSGGGEPRDPSEGVVEAPVVGPGEDSAGGPGPGGGADPSGAPSAQELEAARAAMRQRYRPGPYVHVQGMLPSGMTNTRRLTSDDRQGRTIDNPWIVPGATLRPGNGVAHTAGGPGLLLANPAAPSVNVIAGVPASLEIVASAGEGDDGAVQGLEIRFEGYPGHFYLPAVVDSELGPVRVAGVDRATFNFGIDSPVLPGGAPLPPNQRHSLTMYVTSIDAAGRASLPVGHRVEILPLGSGDVEVTLTMDQATDLDLYVVEGTGQMVFYGNRRIASGAHLDLDANAGCGSNMGVNTEHVYWPDGAAPPGTYTVRVAHYESCVGGAAVPYRVTVANCGETAVFTGVFTGTGNTQRCSSDPGADRDWCQTVVSFEVTPCAAGANP